MTAQISDVIRIGDEVFHLVGIDGGPLYDPKQDGITTRFRVTSCWRGFQCEYAVQSERLLLEKLNLNSERMPPDLFGVVPQRQSGDRHFDFVYHFNEALIPFSGGILAAKDFIRELYVHLGFHPAWKFERVQELIFDKGYLVESHDRSRAVAEIRARRSQQPLEPRGGASHEEIAEWVESSFRRDYKM
jgi:hypothetical protein